MDIDLRNNKALEELWAESKGTAGPETFRELARLGRRIDAVESRRRSLRSVAYAFAAAAVLALVALATFSLTRDKFQVSPLEGTASLVAEYGKTASTVLPDGSKVALNSGSTLVYPESFDGKSRIVYLSGQANFSVAKDPDKPFIVKTTHMDVRALGTTFCVQSYLGERTVRTTLKEGRVKVDVPEAGDRSYFLEPGMQLVYVPGDNSISLARVDAAKVLGWEEGYLSFINATFPEIATALERRFGVSIGYNAENMRHNSLNVRFLPDESLEDVLEVLSLLLPGSRYKIEGDRVYWSF